MAHILRFECNGEYLNLHQGYYRVEQYEPQTPNLSTVDISSELLDGGERPVVTRRNVTETAQIMLHKGLIGTMVNLQSALQEIEDWFKQAEDYQNSQLGYPVYVEFQPDGTTDMYRSELLSGKVDLENNGMRRWVTGKAIKLMVAWTRRWYWEASTEVSLGFAEVDNGEMFDFTDFSATPITITGAIPAPLRIRYLLDATATETGNVMIGEYVDAPATFTYFTHILEAEDGGADDVVDANSSGGKYLSIDLNGTEAALQTWDLSGGVQIETRSKYFRVVARFAAALDDQSRFRLSLKYTRGAVTITLFEGSVISTGTSRLLDLGVVKIPPWYYPRALVQTGDTVILSLSGYTADASTQTESLDCLFLLPLDHYREYQTDIGILAQDELHDHPIVGVYNYLHTEHGYMNLYAVSGAPLMVYPGKNSMFVLINQWVDGTSDLDDLFTVYFWYRPRKLTL